ncbi:MAG: archaellin/type IV pilin N-terminal domain-containing protein [Candidatus Pacearchaeota archaeon]|jgi:flagellin-like protein
MNNKKGLSDVVTTLIIILLVLIAVGVIWGVVNNLLNKSKGSIEGSTKCFDLDITATKLNQTSNVTGDYALTLKRSATGDNVEIFAKVVVSNNMNSSGVLDIGSQGGLTPLGVKTYTLQNTGITDVSKVEVTPYYIDENGQEKLCTITNSFDF